MRRGGLNGRRVHIVTPVLAPHDAIGNDVLGMAKCLRRNGVEVAVYADSVHPSLKAGVKVLTPTTDSFWTEPEALVIYHHSMAWPTGQEIVAKCRGRLAVKYHNVTPPEFFEGYSPEYVNACKAGQHATSELAGNRRALFWADSGFNASDLIAQGASEHACRVLPPFHIIESIGSMAPDVATMSAFQAHTGTRLLFVGGIKPNKGHRTLIRVFARFRRFHDPDAVLVFAGNSDPRLSAYRESLVGYAREMGVEDGILFMEGISAAVLRSLYLLADVFVCLSDHEGFCVPLIEAMYFRTPIVASAWTAVAETVGDAGIVCSHGDLKGIAAAIDRCATMSDLSSRLMCAGWRRFHETFATGVLENRFLMLVEEALER